MSVIFKMERALGCQLPHGNKKGKAKKKVFKRGPGKPQKKRK